ncbi:hypothetical protein FA95DRAFT_755711 [Auriscalpium vulgare]|uniref:Uncharacterized protein n=1 Tax=Auriscalpium vulgare TaxID=40419 RepID=A0ACB8S0U6_9AGAM|nr:hypothetical protein FA95DRAFT_755711 [Auriscalpium vulgare]
MSRASRAGPRPTACVPCAPASPSLRGIPYVSIPICPQPPGRRCQRPEASRRRRHRQDAPWAHLPSSRRAPRDAAGPSLEDVETAGALGLAWRMRSPSACPCRRASGRIGLDQNRTYLARL